MDSHIKKCRICGEDVDMSSPGEHSKWSRRNITHPSCARAYWAFQEGEFRSFHPFESEEEELLCNIFGEKTEDRAKKRKILEGFINGEISFKEIPVE